MTHVIPSAPSVILSEAKNLLLLFAIASTASAQTLATQVDRAPDGVVRMQMRSRPGVCGDGRDVVGYRSAIFARNFQSIGGRWREDRCVPGDLRVALYKVDGQVNRLRTEVGGAWPQTEQRVTDLGVVAPAEASAYLFSIVPRLERFARDDRTRMLIPAVLSAVEPPLQALLALARDEERNLETRRAAIHWMGLLGDASVVPTLLQFARGTVDDEGNDKYGLGGGAVAALSMIDDGAGIPGLIDLSRAGSVGTRRNAVFWLGQNGDPRGRRRLHEVIEDANEISRVRSHAVFSLAHGRETPENEFAWLRDVYARVDDREIKEAILQGMGNDGDPVAERWMIQRALDVNESRKLRKSAVFWAGQRNETPTPDRVRVYRDAQDNELREHAIFVLSQRSDDAAVEALIRIAREDRDTAMRGKALFWLGQKDDPRAKKLIADIILRQP